jgi:hypothetical protein
MPPKAAKKNDKKGPEDGEKDKVPSIYKDILIKTVPELPLHFDESEYDKLLKILLAENCEFEILTDRISQQCMRLEYDN